jgi:hypothetical protein
MFHFFFAALLLSRLQATLSAPRSNCAAHLLLPFVQVEIGRNLVSYIGIGFSVVTLHLSGQSSMDAKFEKIDAKFEKMDAKFENKFEKIDAKFEKMDKKIDDLREEMRRGFDIIFDKLDILFKD